MATFAQTVFTDVVRLQTPAGRIPADIPAHYWRFAWSIHREHRGNKVPQVDCWSAMRRAKPICLPYRP